MPRNLRQLLAEQAPHTRYLRASVMDCLTVWLGIPSPVHAHGTGTSIPEIFEEVERTDSAVRGLCFDVTLLEDNHVRCVDLSGD